MMIVMILILMKKKKKKHENIINQFNDRINSNNNNNILNKTNINQNEDSDVEQMEKIINLVGGGSDKKIEFPIHKNINKKMTIEQSSRFNSLFKKKDTKLVEMKTLEEKSN